MCRDVALVEINSILEDIHNGVELEKIKQNCETFKVKCNNYEELCITKKEIRVDRLKEYIKFFNLSGICEYDIFVSPNVFYKLLKKYLEKSEWKKIKAFLKRGDILTFYE